MSHPDDEGTRMLTELGIDPCVAGHHDRRNGVECSRCGDVEDPNADQPVEKVIDLFDSLKSALASPKTIADPKQRIEALPLGQVKR